MAKSIKHENPYKRGMYLALFAFVMEQVHKVGAIMRPRPITRQELLAFAKSLGMSESGANASVTVILSPTESSERGDCRGNMSAMGHLYYFKRSKKDGVTYYELRWRNPAMEPHRRAPAVKATKPVKPAKPAKVVKAKARKARKARKSKGETPAPAPQTEPAQTAPVPTAESVPPAPVAEPQTATTEIAKTAEIAEIAEIAQTEPAV